VRVTVYGRKGDKVKTKVKAIFYATLLALSLAVMGTEAFAADVQASQTESFAQGTPLPPAPPIIKPLLGRFGVSWED
jgi:amino acid transporter